MWRDRTNLYISYRQSYAHHPAKKTKFSPSSRTYPENGSANEETQGLMSAAAFDDSGDAIIEMDLLPPRWLDIRDEVSDKLDEVTKNMTTLEKLHQKHVLPGFDDESVKKKEEREIEAMTQSITRGFQSCQASIKRIDGMVREAHSSGNITRAEETMAQNLKISLATRVGDISALFRKKQSAYLKKMRALGGIESPFDRASTPLNPYTDPSLMETESDRASAQGTILQTKQKQRQGLQDTTIQQREREIEQIAQGIIDLANIFQDLQTMVIDQGTMLDRIDYNVEKMATEVKEADKELTIATGYQKKSTKRKIILLLVLLVVGMFILILVKPKRTNEPAPSNPEERPVPVGIPPTILRGNPFSLDEAGVADVIRRDWRRRRKANIEPFE
ncbi:t-SNARE affecting a late Golgi compartment protein 2 [Sphaceloma murrayae]|uniref:t-SNARE affecting a late Golgi compartment protein 2 n=1 Tax=Sphaceloma murrayae TaxID=2082308 RepID=A0A2K1QK41_9PEZI|nr:t-SNARE affecting a late Golgi compartment protein 2 [Sphaceloma murrayae]